MIEGGLAVAELGAGTENVHLGRSATRLPLPCSDFSSNRALRSPQMCGSPTWALGINPSIYNKPPAQPWDPLRLPAVIVRKKIKSFSL